MVRKQSAQRKTHTPDPGNTRRWRSVRRQIDALDVATFNAIAGTYSTAPIHVTRHAINSPLATRRDARPNRFSR